MSTLLAIETFGKLATHWLPMLLDAALKGLVILALAWTATLLIRRASATAGHRVFQQRIIAETIYATVGFIINKVIDPFPFAHFFR